MEMDIELQFGVVLIIVANFIWYRTKFLLNKRGYEVGFLTGHLKDYPNLINAISKENDPQLRNQLIIQKHLMLSLWLVVPVAIMLVAVAGSRVWSI